MKYFNLFNWIGDFLSNTRQMYLFVMLIIALVIVVFFCWPDIKRKHWIFILSFCCVLSVGVIHQIAFNTIAEDAFIGFRYSCNLAEGYGLVFNIGKHVEGYSNFLWIVLLAGINRFLCMDIPTTARIIGGILSFFVVLISYKITWRLTKNLHISLLTVLVIGSIGAYASWGLSGLENPLFAVWFMLAIASAFDKHWWITSIYLLLMSLTRIDGVVFIPPFLIFAYIYTPKTERVKTLTRLVVPFFVIYLIYTIWRISYFGYFIPNTVAAKNCSSILYRIFNGVRYISNYFVTYGTLIILFIAAFNAFITAVVKKIDTISIKKVYTALKETFLPEEVLLLLVTGTYICFIIFIGGDWMPTGRFLYVIIPPFVILGLSLWQRHIKETFLQLNSKIGISLFFIACIICFYNSFLVYDHIPEVRVWKNQITGLAEIGQWLNSSLPESTIVAVTANGSLSYHSKLPTIDMHGLTDEHIGRKGKRLSRGVSGQTTRDYEYVVSQKPQIVVYSGGGFSDSPHPFKMLKEFEDLYDAVPFYFKNSTNPRGKFIELWLLRSQKDKLIELLTMNNDVEVFHEVN